jgi:hypothetical protein
MSSMSLKPAKYIRFAITGKLPPDTAAAQTTTAAVVPLGLNLHLPFLRFTMYEITGLRY